MFSMTHILLFNFSSLTRIDVLLWVVGIPAVIAFVIALYLQIRQHSRLKTELDQLNSIKHYNIEYELVLKAMRLSIWHLDVVERTVTFESDYRDEMNNYVPDGETSIDTLFDCLVPEDLERVREAMLGLMEGKYEDYHQQYRLQTPQTQNTYWEETFATVDKRDMEGKPLSIVGTTMRIDERKAIEQALIEARNQAEESDRLKTAFLANMTHEVRTPLNAIVGFSDILPMAQSDEERNELIKLIKQNNAHLLRLFDDMMNMSRLESGNAGSIVKEDFELASLFSELVEKYQAPCMEKSLELSIEDSASGDMVHTDRGRLREILNQYLNNALKFTSAGSISLGYEKQLSTVRIWVRDTGKGIPADKCNDHLFERFVKVDDFVAGTGLGLSICRSLAESLDGRVGVDSVFGEGSTFWVEIPL
jgi:signal transduction histidine kinase